MEEGIREKVRLLLEDIPPFPEDSLLLVGFSGGADSTALVLMLDELGYEVRAVHLNHGIRGVEAKADEEWCRRFCRTHRIPFESHPLDVLTNKAPGESMEMAARRLRLTYWKSIPGAVVALGHHRDDALETTLLRFCRGCNTSGLHGLRASTTVEGVRLIRPLLNLTRMELERYLRMRGINDFRIDHTNADVSILRNKVRHELIPIMRELAGGARALYKTVEFIEADANYLEDSARKVDVSTMNRAELTQLPLAIFQRAVRNWLKAATGEEITFPEPAVLRLREALNADDGKSRLVELSGTYFIHTTTNGLTLEQKEGPRLQRTIHWDWRGKPRMALPELGISLVADPCKERPSSTADSECFDSRILGQFLVVRGRKPGDRMIPFGAEHPKKLKKLISDRKLTPTQRQQLIVVANSRGEILWVPSVRRSETSRITKDTSHIVQISIVPLEEDFEL